MEPVTDLQQIFADLKAQMTPYSPPLSAMMDTVWRYELASVKKVEIAGRKRDEVYFASLIIQKDYVGFYYMPVYTDPEIKALFPAELLSLLKGKSCFHIKKLDDLFLDQVRAVLKDGFALYQQRGWV